MTPTKHGMGSQSARRSGRVAEDYSAFMALRPGSGGKPAATASQADEGGGSPTPRRRNLVDELRSVRRAAAPKRQKVAFKPRRDWTYRETAWTSEASVANAQKELDQVRASSLHASARLTISDSGCSGPETSRHGRCYSGWTERRVPLGPATQSGSSKANGHIDNGIDEEIASSHRRP